MDPRTFRRDTNLIMYKQAGSPPSSRPATPHPPTPADSQKSSRDCVWETSSSRPTSRENIRSGRQVSQSREEKF
jgi:hypothetical protein